MNRNQIALGLGAFAAGVAAWTFGASRYGRKTAGLLRDAATDALRTAGDAASDALRAGSEATGIGGSEHVPTDLLSDTPVTTATRAPAAFRPDPTAVPTAQEREALRPATGSAPGFAADRGTSIG